jgi:TIR domain
MNSNTKVGVFISYNHVDVQIALEIHRCLRMLSDRLEVFFDHANLVGGDEYEAKIASSIQSSIWFIFIATGDISDKDMTWCFYEAGQFRAKFALSRREKIAERMCVLFDGDGPPRQMSQFLGVRVTPLDAAGQLIELDRNKPTFNETRLEQTPIYLALKTLLQKSIDEPLRDLGDSITLSNLRECSRAIIEAVVRSKNDLKLAEVPLQPRISLTIPAALDDEFAEIEPSTDVAGFDNALSSVFQLAGSHTTWSEIKQAARLPNGADPLWLEDVERGICKYIAKNRVPPQTDMICVSGQSVFRPIITRYVPYRSGKRDVHIIFSPMQKRPLVASGLRVGSPGIPPKFGLLLMGLIMAIRFRQRVIPLIDVIEQAADDAADTLLRIEREIGYIEAEAQEYGFPITVDAADAQQSILVDAISDEADRKAAKRFLEEYIPIRVGIVKSVQDVRNVRNSIMASDVRESIVARLKQVKSMSGPYISIIMRELTKQQLDLVNE